VRFSLKKSFAEIKTSAESTWAFAIRRIVVADHFFPFFSSLILRILFSKRRPTHQLAELAFKKQSYYKQSHESDVVNTRFSSGPRQRLLLLLYRNFFFFYYVSSPRRINNFAHVCSYTYIRRHITPNKIIYFMYFVADVVFIVPRTYIIFDAKTFYVHTTTYLAIKIAHIHAHVCHVYNITYLLRFYFTFWSTWGYLPIFFYCRF